MRRNVLLLIVFFSVTFSKRSFKETKPEKLSYMSQMPLIKTSGTRKTPNVTERTCLSFNLTDAGGGFSILGLWAEMYMKTRTRNDSFTAACVLLKSAFEVKKSSWLGGSGLLGPT